MWKKWPEVGPTRVEARRECRPDEPGRHAPQLRPPASLPGSATQPFAGGEQVPSTLKSAQVGLQAALWCPHATHRPWRPPHPRPVRAGWTPFGSVGALRRDARSYIFRRRGLGVDGPPQYGPRCECKTALKPATAPSPLTFLCCHSRLMLRRLAGSGCLIFLREILHARALSSHLSLVLWGC